MDLALTETQEMLKRLARDFLAQEFPISLLREMEADEKGYSPDVWRKMAETGLINTAIPEELGGAGGDLMDLGVILGEMGRGLYIGPFFSTIVLGGLTLMYGGSDEQKRGMIPSLAQGQILLSLALLEETGRYNPASIQLEAQLKGDHYILNGTKLFVEYGHVADYILCVARTGSGDADLTIFLVPSANPGIQVTSLDTIGSDKQAEIRFDNVAVPAPNVIGGVNQGWPIMQQVLDAATALLCMQMVGMAEKVLERTVEYVKMRVQFGRPLGSLQAVQHHCADMVILSDGARLAAQEAVSRLAQGLPARREVALAKAFCSKACQEVTLTAHQLHGGVGFMQEFDLQIYTRQMEGMVLRMGTADEHLEVFAQEMAL